MRHSGKTITLADLYERYAPSLYAYARLLSRSPAEAEDVVQSWFVRLAVQLDRLAEVENQRGYVLTVCRNEAFRNRSRWRRWWDGDLACGTVQFEETESGAPPEPENHDAISRAVAALPPEQREVVFLKVWQEMTFAEIAELLGISPNTAASRYRYGLEKLKGLLEHER